jgi:hypothetical protein
MRIHEITEARQGMLGYLQSLVPSWPGYVVKDWLYASFSKSGWAGMRQEVEELLLNQGLTATTQWRLQTVPFTMTMWEPTTKTRLTSRAGGTPQPEFNVPRDADRHATQAGLAQQQGGVRDEPVIMVKTQQGWELIEGWHRTIQHFATYPNGYQGPAWIAQSAH